MTKEEYWSMMKEKQVWLVKEDYDEFITIEGIFSTKEKAEKLVDKLGYGYVERWIVDELDDFMNDKRRVFVVNYFKDKNWCHIFECQNVNPLTYQHTITEDIFDCLHGHYITNVFAESEEEAEKIAMKRFEEYFKHDD